MFKGKGFKGSFSVAWGLGGIEVLCPSVVQQLDMQHVDGW